MSVYTRAFVYVCMHRPRLNIGSCLQAPQGRISVAEARPLLVCVTPLFLTLTCAKLVREHRWLPWNLVCRMKPLLLIVLYPSTISSL